MLIPLKVVGESDLTPTAASEAEPVVFQVVSYFCVGGVYPK
jgi:hypothetical protein